VTITICRLLLAALFVAGCDNAPESDGLMQLKLPSALREISGLAVTTDGALLAVADEKAHVFRISFDPVTIERFTKFGDPAKKGDFEGITLLHDDLYLVTSNGVLWQKQLTAAPKDYTKIKTGLGKQCEIEGLTAWPERQWLLLLCKKSRHKNTRGQLTVYAWSAARQQLLDKPFIQLNYREAGLPKLSPSGITLSNDTQQFIIVAAKEQSYLTLNLDGSVSRWGQLPDAGNHRQAEGIAITPGNTVYIADEGKTSRGTITRYEHSF